MRRQLQETLWKGQDAELCGGNRQPPHFLVSLLAPA